MHTPNNEKSKRIMRNTMLLYSRMFIVLFVSLFTSRLILQILGVTDFGIYSVVGGIVIIFNVLSSSLSESTSRFFSYSIGKNDTKDLKVYFHTSRFVYVIIGVVTFVAASILGLWLIENKLLIPEERISAAKTVLVFSILSFILKISNIPYTALIISNERMAFYATFGIVEVLFKLVNILLLYIIDFDHLITFSILSLTEPVFNKIILTYYCYKHFGRVCRGKFLHFGKRQFAEMSNFAGWDMLGAVERILQDQGVNVVINMFCMPSVNAARAISIQVKSAVTQFTTNFQVAVNPQIIKSYAEKDTDYLLFLLYRTSKFSFFLLLLLVCPIFTHTEFVLTLWLGSSPEHAILFVRLIMLLVLSDTFYEILNQGAKATGKIKFFRICTSFVSLLNLPIAYLFLFKGFAPEMTVIITIVLNIFVLFTQLGILRKLVGISISKFLTSVMLPNYSIAIIVLVLSISSMHIVEKDSWAFFIVQSFLFTLLTMSIIYKFGLSVSERHFIKNIVLKRIKNNVFI